MDLSQQKLFIVAAPSGAGKTTLVSHVLTQFDCFEFSISATTRAARSYEIPGEHYYFLSEDEFMQKVEAGEFLEWEEVYAGTYYGTLKSEVDRIFANAKVPLFDVDVEGGLSIKQYYGTRAVSIFIRPPRVEVLLSRLQNRATDSATAIKKRYAKARLELQYAQRFDVIIVNDVLEDAKREITQLIASYLDPV